MIIQKLKCHSWLRSMYAGRTFLLKEYQSYADNLSSQHLARASYAMPLCDRYLGLCFLHFWSNFYCTVLVGWIYAFATRVAQYTPALWLVVVAKGSEILRRVTNIIACAAKMLRKWPGEASLDRGDSAYPRLYMRHIVTLIDVSSWWFLIFICAVANRAEARDVDTAFPQWPDDKVLYYHV